MKISVKTKILFKKRLNKKKVELIKSNLLTKKKQKGCTNVLINFIFLTKAPSIL